MIFACTQIRALTFFLELSTLMPLQSYYYARNIKKTFFISEGKTPLFLDEFHFSFLKCSGQDFVHFLLNNFLVLLLLKMTLQQGWCLNTGLCGMSLWRNESWHYIKHNKGSQLMKIIAEHTNLLNGRGEKYQFYTLASQKKMWFVI